MSRQTPTTRECFSGPEAARLAGISYRRLDYWARKKFVEPSIGITSGQGNYRVYSSLDVVALRLARRLRDQGVSLATIRRAVAALNDGRGIQGVAGSYKFFVDQGRLYAQDRSGNTISVARGAQLVFAITLGVRSVHAKKPLAKMSGKRRASQSLVLEQLRLSRRS